MARAHWSISILRRHGRVAPPRPAALVRFLGTESRDDGEKLTANADVDSLPDIARRVCEISRSRPRWESSLISSFPSFDFSNPAFMQELLKKQSNLLISLRFFYWTLSHYGISPDAHSCELLFGLLVEANACRLAKAFISRTGFAPEPALLQRYAMCLFNGGLVDDAMEVFRRLKKEGAALKPEMWNAALSGCVKAKRTELVWELYGQMVASGSLADMGVDIAGHLIQAFCLDGEVLRGYKLLRLVLEEGLVPREAAFNALISHCCTRREIKLDRVSELLHIMIEKNCSPSLVTYQAVIDGLFRRVEPSEALRVFTELKDRGYAPDRQMYGMMIRRLCEMKWVWEARKLLCEMISKGFLPEEDTVCVVMNTFFKNGNTEAAQKLFIQMADNGLRGNTAIYNVMISGLISCKKRNQAWDVFQEMAQKGIARNYLTYYQLIECFSKRGKKEKCKQLYEEAVVQCLLNEIGDIEGAKILLKEMKRRGITPSPMNEIVTRELSKRGLGTEASDRLVKSLRNEVKPQKKTSKKGSSQIFMYEAGRPSTAFQSTISIKENSGSL